MGDFAALPILPFDRPSWFYLFLAYRHTGFTSLPFRIKQCAGINEPVMAPNQSVIHPTDLSISRWSSRRINQGIDEPAVQRINQLAKSTNHRCDVTIDAPLEHGKASHLNPGPRSCGNLIPSRIRGPFYSRTGVRVDGRYSFN